MRVFALNIMLILPESEGFYMAWAQALRHPFLLSQMLYHFTGQVFKVVHMSHIIQLSRKISRKTGCCFFFCLCESKKCRLAVITG